MKKFLLIAFVFFGIHSFAQSAAQFSATKHSFGKIKQGTPVSFTFPFKNTGNKPLIVEVATAECGCTTPEYPKEPIAKGKEGKIKVTFNAETSGSFSKKVTVKLADADNPVILTIEGEVITKK